MVLTALNNLASCSKIQSSTLHTAHIRNSVELLLYAKRLAEGTSAGMIKPDPYVYVSANKYGEIHGVPKAVQSEG